MGERIRKVSEAVLIGLAVVLFWRGAWGLADLYLLPHNEVLSYVVSLIFGGVILIAGHRMINRFLY